MLTCIYCLRIYPEFTQELAKCGCPGCGAGFLVESAPTHRLMSMSLSGSLNKHPQAYYPADRQEGVYVATRLWR